MLRGNYDGTPLPSLILAFRDHDAVVACFDEKAQHMLEASSEPTFCVIFSPDNPAEFERACRAVGRFVAFNVELFTLVEEIRCPGGPTNPIAGPCETIMRLPEPRCARPSAAISYASYAL